MMSDVLKQHDDSRLEEYIEDVSEEEESWLTLCLSVEPDINRICCFPAALSPKEDVHLVLTYHKGS